MMDIVEPNTVHERLSMLIDYFCKGNKTAFGRETDILPGVLASITGGRLSKPSFELLQKIMTRYPAVSGDWLILGRGPMTREESVQPVKSSHPTISPEDLLSINEMQEQTERMQRAFQLVQRALGVVADAALSPEEAKQLKKDFPDSFPAAE